MHGFFFYWSYPLWNKRCVLLMSLADSADVRRWLNLEAPPESVRSSASAGELTPSLPVDHVLDLNGMVRRALVQAAPHLDWSSEAVDEILQEIHCKLCLGTGLKRIGDRSFSGCEACLEPNVKLSVVCTVVRAVVTPDLSLSRFLESVPESTISEAERVVLLDVPRNAQHVVEEEWVAVREDGTYGQGMSPMEAFLNLELQCQERDSILATLARQANLSDQIRAKVMQLVANEK